MHRMTHASKEGLHRFTGLTYLLSVLRVCVVDAKLPWLRCCKLPRSPWSFTCRLMCAASQGSGTSHLNLAAG